MCYSLFFYVWLIVLLPYLHEDEGDLRFDDLEEHDHHSNILKEQHESILGGQPAGMFS